MMERILTREELEALRDLTGDPANWHPSKSALAIALSITVKHIERVGLYSPPNHNTGAARRDA